MPHQLALALTVAASVFFGGFLAPMPQDALLLLAGYYASANGINPYGAVIAAVLAVLAADTLIFALGRTGSKFVAKLTAKISPERRTQFAASLNRHAGKSIFFGRFVMGVRIIVPVVSGTSGMPWLKFSLYNAAAVVVYVPTFVMLGFVYHDRLSKILHGLTVVEHAFLILALVASALFVVYGITQYFLGRLGKEK